METWDFSITKFWSTNIPMNVRPKLTKINARLWLMQVLWKYDDKKFARS